MDNGVLNKHADQDRVAKRAGVLKDGDTQSHRGSYEEIKSEIKRSMRGSVGSGSTEKV